MDQPPPAASTPIPPSTAERTSTAATRRTFLFGGAAGVVVGGAAGVVAAKAPGWVCPPAPVPDPLPDGTKLSYAQFGEDLVANSLFYSIKMDKPTYLDIGEFEPISSNNTYFFYQRGARGVLVEPTPYYAEKLKAVRPDDTVLGAGIGLGHATEMDFYIMSEPQHNTFKKEHAELFAREKGYKIERVLKIPLLDINRVMADHFGGAAPDYLSIDAEGWEFDIAKTIDFSRFRPKVICIETLVPNTVRHYPEIGKYMAERGYEVHGMTYPNTLYMDKAVLK